MKYLCHHCKKELTRADKEFGAIVYECKNCHDAWYEHTILGSIEDFINEAREPLP